MQDTYPFLSDKSETKPYCKSEVSAYLGRTNFKERDGHGRYNDYLSTASVSFQPASTQCEYAGVVLVSLGGFFSLVLRYIPYNDSK